MDNLEEFKRQSQEQLKNLCPTDIQLLTDDTLPENITIIARPDYKAQESIQRVIEDLEQLDLDQYYYAPSQLHLTLIGNIDNSIRDENITNCLNAILPKYNMSFRLMGIGSNKHASSVNAYPNFDIHAFRKNIRDFLHVAGDDYTVHLAIYEYMGWLNYMRYLHIPSQEFLDKLYSYKETAFGEMKPRTIEAYRCGSKVLDLGKSKLIYSVEM